MFIRRVQTRPRPGSDEPYASFRLVRNERSGRAVRQVTLLNLGAAFDVPRARWPQLVQLIENCLSHQLPDPPPDPDLLARAESLAEALRARGFGQPEPPGSDLATVNLDSLAHSHDRSVGCERLALAALDTLGFRDALRTQGVSDRDARLATALVVAHMVHPSNERETHAWLTQASATLELLGLESARPLAPSKLDRIGNLLWRHRDALEAALFQRERTLLDRPPTLVFYDLTPMHSNGRPRGDLRPGRSKQKHKERPLMTLALALDGAGFPGRSEILPGNVSEPDTLEGALRRLEELPHEAGPRPTVVLDAELATAENLAWLKRERYDWIAVRRGGEDRPEREADLEFETRGGRQVQVWHLARRADEAELCLGTEEQRAKDDAIVARMRAKFEAGLQALQEGLARKGGTKQYALILERVARLKERYPRVAGQYAVTVQQAASPRRSPGQSTGEAKPQPARAAALNWERTAADATGDARAGISVLRTSHTDWDLERAVQTYRQLAEVEATFRSLQSEIGLRPIRPTKPQRTRTHLFLAVLAYHPVRLLQTRLAQAGRTESWATVRRRLASWVRLTTTVQARNGELITWRQDARPDAEAAALARAAGVEPGMHRVQTRLAAPTAAGGVDPEIRE